MKTSDLDKPLTLLGAAWFLVQIAVVWGLVLAFMVWIAPVVTLILG